MVRTRSARRSVALALTALTACMLVSTGSALAADRVVFAENFTNTG